MGTYLPPGSCEAEYKALLDAEKALEKAGRAYESAKHNMQAGGVAVGAGGIAAIGCVFFMTGVGAAVCAGGAGASMISGELWTLSAGESLINAQEDLEAAMDAAEAAMKAFCECYNTHAVCVPD